jgi:probable selenate reductase FAD-binding subunit
VNPSYHRPTTIAQALQLKAELGPGAVFLAGGTEVNNRLAGRPTALIDIAGLRLDAVDRTDSGVRLGAGVTFQRLVDHPDVPGYIKTAALQMVNRNIRNRATVGGHLGNNRSCADLIPVLVAAQAQVQLADRELPVEQLVQSAPGLILSVFVPRTERRFGLMNMTRTASDISLIAVAVSLRMEGDCIREPIVAVGGVAAHVVRLAAVEKALDGRPLPSAQHIEPLIAGSVSPIDDLRGSAAYKRHLAAVLGERALKVAVLGERALKTAVDQAGPTEGGR